MPTDGSDNAVAGIREDVADNDVVLVARGTRDRSNLGRGVLGSVASSVVAVPPGYSFSVVCIHSMAALTPSSSTMSWNRPAASVPAVAANRYSSTAPADPER